MLSNRNIFLRPMELYDAEKVGKWRFSEDNYSYFYEFTPTSRFVNELWFQDTLKKKTELNFIITEKNGNIDIGMISLVDIDFRNQKCEMGRVLIAEKDARGKGFGKQAIQLLLEYAFKHLNMHKVYCEVLSDNLTAIETYKKCGFIQDGYFENHIYKNGDFKDVIHLSVYR